MELGVNIDHVATLRQARYRANPDSPNAEPDPVAAALAAERAGATGITAHLRADRRHLQDADLFRLRESVQTKLNLEMGNSPEILGIALETGPDDVCLVPENREEVTTEGGLDCEAHENALRETVDTLQRNGIRVSLFIDPDQNQILAASRLKAEFVELHTGAFAEALGDHAQRELHRLVAAAELADSLGLKVNAGHGINYQNIGEILKIPHIVELNIGHSLIARAMVCGIEEATREMLRLMQKR